MPPSLLTLSHLSVARDQQRVLHDVSAQAASHQFVALLGPNGAGKSSLLAAIAGELPLSAGHCLFDGLPLNHTPPHTLARRRALLPQQSMLDFDFTVRDVVKLGALPFPEIPDAELEALCDSVLRLSDAANLAERRYPALSGGEQQRAQIARVLLQACAAAALGPALLLLDEPTANLDPRHQHLMLAGLQELCHSIPLTIIASLHDVNLAMAYTDLAWLLDGGRLLAAGAPAQTLTPKRLTEVFKLPVRNVEGYLLFNLPERTREAASPPSIG